MKKEDVITLDDNKDYLILDTAELLGKKYLYTVEVDKDDMPTTNYKYYEVTEDSDGISVEEVVDEKVLEAILNIFTINYLSDSIDKDEEQAA